MSTEAEIPQLSSAPASKLASGGAVNVDAGELVELSVRGLLPMFDSSSRQFCFRMVQTPAGLRREGLSHRYTVITLLGLCELERAGTPSPFPISSILEQLLEDKKWPVGAGDFGLLLWLTSIRAPEKLPALLSRFNLRNALDAYADVRAGLTMELAWLLTGLSRAILSARPELPGLADLARSTYSALVKNQGRGFFGHVSTSKTIAGRLRGWMGSFADQVYPILAMTRYSQAFESREALSRALECGRAICRVQGPLGQWWWHYDSRAGKVASMYPVFSVHQDGMAPMALFPLGEVSGTDFREHIYRGLRWIGGANELGRDIRDLSAKMIWRRVHPAPEYTMKLDVLASHLGVYRNASGRKMEILHECRPYHFGWLLYAFATRAAEERNR